MIKRQTLQTLFNLKKRKKFESITRHAAVSKRNDRIYKEWTRGGDFLSERKRERKRERKVNL